jgi:hypothetical protein
VVLSWALKLFAIPPHDELVQFNPMWRALGLLEAKTAQSLLANPELRSRDEIRVLRNQMFAMHWRLRDYHLRPKIMDFAEFSRTCRFGPLDISGLPLQGGDLSIGGKRLDHAETDAFKSASSAAQERHQAVNWLWEGPKTYSSASVAT